MTACFLFLPSSFFYCVPLFSFLGWFRVGCGIRVGPEYGCLVPQAPKHWAVPAVDESGFAACIAQRMHTVMQGAVVVPVILSPVDQDVADSLHRRGMVEARRRDSSSRLGRIWRGRDTAIVRVVLLQCVVSDGVVATTTWGQNHRGRRIEIHTSVECRLIGGFVKLVQVSLLRAGASFTTEFFVQLTSIFSPINQLHTRIQFTPDT
jgi:hypothetical protein